MILIFIYIFVIFYQELDVGLANGIRTMNLTHTGELGYVLYIPNEVIIKSNSLSNRP